MLPAHDTPAFRELLHQQVEKRRTFAIISHPDAGKTTLTEKLLLYGGAIRSAGSVKARKSDKHATSDWMDIEKQRGISVTSSAMQFEFDGFRINILDTPGHQDFSEDTYRVLVAADAAVMLIDAAKGVGFRRKDGARRPFAPRLFVLESARAEFPDRPDRLPRNGAGGNAGGSGLCFGNRPGHRRFDSIPLRTGKADRRRRT